MAGLYTEADYENSVVELFKNMGYTYVYGPDIERDFKSPLYDDVLVESLHRINKGLPEDAITDALYKLKNFENGELVQKNAVFMDYLQNGIPVRYVVKGEERASICYLVDYKNPENNSFIVANQWTFIENSNKRPDVLLFLNGLPVVLVELKSPSREETDASEAYLQIRNYKVRVWFDREYAKDGSPYLAIFCRVRKKDVPKFLAALEDLKNSMMLCGHPHYIEEISSFMDEMEKMKGALHGDENDAAQETEQKRTA